MAICTKILKKSIFAILFQFCTKNPYFSKKILSPESKWNLFSSRAKIMVFRRWFFKDELLFIREREKNVQKLTLGKWFFDIVNDWIFSKEWDISKQELWVFLVASLLSRCFSRCDSEITKNSNTFHTSSFGFRIAIESVYSLFFGFDNLVFN